MFTIFTDTSANLPTPYLRQQEIGVIPLTYRIGAQEFACLDTEAFDGHAYYDQIRRAVEVNTSQIPPQHYLDAFTPVLAAGKDILFVGMSSGISGSYQAASIAATQLRAEFPQRKLCLVDTLAASLGEGLLVMDAVRMRDEGAEADQAAKLLLQGRKNVCQLVVLDDLKHLRRTGRISGKAAVIGSVLNIKPLLKGNPAGQLVMCGKARGMRKGLQQLAEKYAALCVDPAEQVVGIAHTDCPEDAAYLAQLLRQEKPPKEILTVCYEPVTGAHVGPGTVALFFKGAEDVRHR